MTLITRTQKGSKLTIAEMDGNLTYLQTLAQGVDPADLGGLTTTASFNTFTSSYSTGSFTGSFIGDGSGLVGITTTVDTGSLLVTASISEQTLTFTKGNGTTFPITIPNNTPGTKAAQVEITQADILNPSGFLKLLVPSVSGKILVPLSLSVFRRAGGTNYTLSNTIFLNTIIGSNSSSVGNTIPSAIFTSSTEGSLTLLYSLSFNSNLLPNNNLSLVSGTPLSPSTITGGTGNLIAYITYIEIDTN